jgi:ataxia telangiectasia mutated family protein
LSIIIKKYFVPIFGLCIAVRCGTGPEKDLAETVLCESVLQLGEISELERDDLIKKHMVCFPIRTSLNLHVLRDVPLLCDSKLSALSGLFHDMVVLDYFGSK